MVAGRTVLAPTSFYRLQRLHIFSASAARPRGRTWRGLGINILTHCSNELGKQVKRRRSRGDGNLAERCVSGSRERLSASSKACRGKRCLRHAAVTHMLVPDFLHRGNPRADGLGADASLGPGDAGYVLDNFIPVPQLRSGTTPYNADAVTLLERQLLTPRATAYQRQSIAGGEDSGNHTRLLAATRFGNCGSTSDPVVTDRRKCPRRRVH